MFKISRLLKIAAASALAVSVGAAVAFAQSVEETPEPEPEPAPYVIWAGGNEAGLSGVKFFPEVLQVHQGDMVVWEFYGPHNVHFRGAGAGPSFGNFAATVEDGESFVGQDANSGILTPSEDPETVTAFSLVMDAEPGIYHYVCDLHPGMRGTVEIVADDVEILTPEEVAADFEIVVMEAEATLEATAEITQVVSAGAHAH